MLRLRAATGAASATGGRHIAIMPVGLLHLAAAPTRVA
jgi:hypothetical protein